MKILIDCSNLRIGGGIQVGLSFLYDLVNMNRSEKFTVILSPEIEALISEKNFGQNFSFIKLDKRIYKNNIRRSKTIQKIEERENPNVVFVVFGPSFYKSKCLKIVGYAIPHYIYEDSPFFRVISLKERIRIYLKKNIQIRLFKRYSDFLIFETDNARQLFCNKYAFPHKNAHVVSNKLNQIFYHPDLWTNSAKFRFNSSNNILCVSANYKHKNLQIIPKVIDSLYKIGITDFRFIITQTKESLGFDNVYDEHISYVGHIDLTMLPFLYKSVSVLFFPTLLEVFSTTYLEAMYMKIPIVTSDLGFAHDICENSAVYCNPMDPVDCAKKIKMILEDEQLKTQLIENGIINLKRFGGSMDRTLQYLEIINMYNK